MKLLATVFLLPVAAMAECLEQMEIDVDRETAMKMSFAGFEPSVNRYVLPEFSFMCEPKWSNGYFVNFTGLPTLV